VGAEEQGNEARQRYKDMEQGNGSRRRNKDMEQGNEARQRYKDMEHKEVKQGNGKRNGTRKWS